MNNGLTSSPDFVIRSPETDDEIDTYFRLNAEAFRPDEDMALVVPYRRRAILQDPDFQLSQMRSAFYGKSYIGSYGMRGRRLSVEVARLHVGCIGGVVTHPDFRHQGVATALMRDALEIARQRHYDLLLLHGVPGYYQQHGYMDVMEDVPDHAIERALIPEQPVETCNVRIANAQDAPALLALYQEHNRSSMCTFVPSRTLARQVHYLENWFQENIPLLAVNTEGAVEGYLLLARRSGQLYAYEAAANTWPAALALLQYHHRLLEAEADSSTMLSWPLPLTDLTYYLLADHVRVLSEMEAYPDCGWMARIVSFPPVVEALLPALQARWQQSHLDWSGVLKLSVDEQTCFIELSPQQLHLVDEPLSEGRQITLSQQVFTQLVFGFRPISWAAGQAGEHVPAELVPVLDVLFPCKKSWIAQSDGF